jgi:hypothetical protein
MEVRVCSCCIFVCCSHHGGPFGGSFFVKRKVRLSPVPCGFYSSSKGLFPVDTRLVLKFEWGQWGQRGQAVSHSPTRSYLVTTLFHTHTVTWASAVPFSGVYDLQGIPGCSDRFHPGKGNQLYQMVQNLEYSCL